MNIASRQKIVVLGFLSHFPVAGVAWQTLHYLVGFQRLGFEVFYVEAHGCTPSKLMARESDDGAARAAAHISATLRPFGFDGRWAYHCRYPESRCLGLSELQLHELYRSAAVIINLHGSHVPTPELAATGRLVFLETDPVDLQIDLHHGRREAVEYLQPHCAFFSFGENFGAADCRVPLSPQFRFLPTRQPVVLDFWQDRGRGAAEAFTTIGNWRQPWRELNFGGEVYHWSKHLEFLKFIDLPRRAGRPFELALSLGSLTAEDWAVLQSNGWRIQDALRLSSDLDAYRSYIADSHGEFTVAKDQNVRLRSGWFSDRAATYLAAGRPVINQDTGFSNVLPTGAGLFAFSTMEEILEAVAAIDADPGRHRRAASDIAHEWFAHDVVLGGMLDQLGMVRVARQRVHSSEVLPAELRLKPVSRWPTRLAEETLRTASALPIPEVRLDSGRPGGPASIVMVTHNTLPFTKLCVASLLGNGWRRGDELIVVDNASTDGTPEFLGELARRHPFVRFILNPENRGFAAATNQGLELAAGENLILLNNDTVTPRGWLDALCRWLEEPEIGLVGPVTNCTCNEAQISAPYTTYREFEDFAGAQKESCVPPTDLPMLAMYCVALRREILARVGMLDEQFAVAMFEDDDYSRRVRLAGYRVACAGNVFIHHFGQATLGELCRTDGYDRVFEGNREKFEAKWNTKWQPHGRRITSEYQCLRERICESVAAQLPSGATVAVVSKGDEELLRFRDLHGWHFPRAADGGYTNFYPADSAEAIAHMEALREQGANYLLIPEPAMWWLDYYADFKIHLDQRYRVAVHEERTCVVFDLGGAGA